MINKQNLWFATLFSLILILGVYYLKIDDTAKSVLKNVDPKEKEIVEINSSDILVSLEVEKEEEKQKLISKYEDILLSESSSIEEKNTAYENIQNLNSKTSTEDKIKALIKKEFTLDSCVKINDTSITITINKNEHNKNLANNIIRKVQELFEKEQYITVKFN